MAKSKAFWITRNSNRKGVGTKGCFIWHYRRHPRIINGLYECINGGREDNWFCETGFRALTGLILNPGQRVKARLVIKENER